MQDIKTRKVSRECICLVVLQRQKRDGHGGKGHFQIRTSTFRKPNRGHVISYGCCTLQLMYNPNPDTNAQCSTLKHRACKNFQSVGRWRCYTPYQVYKIQVYDSNTAVGTPSKEHPVARQNERIVLTRSGKSISVRNRFQCRWDTPAGTSYSTF